VNTPATNGDRQRTVLLGPNPTSTSGQDVTTRMCVTRHPADPTGSSRKSLAGSTRAYRFVLFSRPCAPITPGRPEYHTRPSACASRNYGETCVNELALQSWPATGLWLRSCTKITYRFDPHMEAAARAAAERAEWGLLLPAAVAVAFIFHGQHQADAIATTCTQTTKSSCFSTTSDSPTGQPVMGCATAE
jgi:hypothetical protein